MTAPEHVLHNLASLYHLPLSLLAVGPMPHDHVPVERLAESDNSTLPTMLPAAAEGADDLDIAGKALAARGRLIGRSLVLGQVLAAHQHGRAHGQGESLQAFVRVSTSTLKETKAICCQLSCLS